VPDEENGTSATGTLIIQPLDFGSSGTYGDDLTADFTFQVLWKPVITCAGDPPIMATGATSGTPGSFTPSGADAPANLAAMSGVTASPTTAWATGEFVNLGDASKAHWDGTAWAAGIAP